MNFISRIHVNFLQNQRNVKCRSRAPDHSWCFKSTCMSRTITVLPIITAAKEIHYFLTRKFLDYINFDKVSEA